MFGILQIKIKRFRYATDLSSNFAYALRYAMDLAVKHDADIFILSVVEQASPSTRAILPLFDEGRFQGIFHVAPSPQQYQPGANTMLFFSAEASCVVHLKDKDKKLLFRSG